MSVQFVHKDLESAYIYYENRGYEYEDPIAVDRDCYIKRTALVIREHFRLSNPTLPVELFEEKIQEEALKSWRCYFKQVIRTHVPQNFIALLSSKSKKKQQKLLKGQSLNAHQLLSFMYSAWIQFGFTSSEYIGRHVHQGLDETNLPKLFYMDNGKVNKIGLTPLSDGRLKNLIEHKKKTVSKFLDKGDEWHCLFITNHSLGGKERWKNGQPHFHYISDKFGIPRAQVVQSLLSRDYSFVSLPHIAFIKDSIS